MKSLIVLSSALTILGIVPGLGLPGALLIQLIAPVCRVVYGREYNTAMERAGDGIWVIAILVTAVWPWALIPVWYAARRYFVRRSMRALATVAGLLLWTNLVGLAAATLVMAA